MVRAIVLVALAGLVVTGCSSNGSDPIRPAPQSVAILPADGAVDVRLDAPVTLRFAVAPDPALVERDFHLFSEPAMSDSACPQAGMGPHDMMSAMGDSGLMRHMDEAHATHGRYMWNATGTECTFRPDSLMQPGTRHMIHLGSDMMDVMGGMGGMGGMPGHGSGQMSGHMLLHFTTVDEDGHGGHH